MRQAEGADFLECVDKRRLISKRQYTWQKRAGESVRPTKFMCVADVRDGAHSARRRAGCGGRVIHGECRAKRCMFADASARKTTHRPNVGQARERQATVNKVSNVTRGAFLFRSIQTRVSD